MLRLAISFIAITALHIVAAQNVYDYPLEYDENEKSEEYETFDKTPIFIEESTVKKKVPVNCVSCRSDATTSRIPQKIDNVIKGTQDEFGLDGRNKVKETPQNVERQKQVLSNALKSAQDAGKFGTSHPSRKLTKVNMKISNLEILDSAPISGEETRPVVPKTRKRIGINIGLRNTQDANKNTSKTPPRRNLTKINSSSRFAAIQARRNSQNSIRNKGSKGNRIQAPRRALTRLQVGRTKNTNTEVRTTQKKESQRTRMRIKDTDMQPEGGNTKEEIADEIHGDVSVQ